MTTNDLCEIQRKYKITLVLQKTKPTSNTPPAFFYDSVYMLETRSLHPSVHAQNYFLWSGLQGMMLSHTIIIYSLA